MRKHERGITFIGICILVTFIGLFVYAGIRLVPVYLEYMNIAKAMDTVKADLTTVDSPNVIRTAIDKRFFIDAVTVITGKDLEITRDGAAWTVRAVYDADAPFVANVSFSVHFDKTVVIGGSGGA
jgi:hypothetical protein